MNFESINLRKHGKHFPADFQEQRERLLAAMDQPRIDGVNTLFVAQAAAAQASRRRYPGWGGRRAFASYLSLADLIYFH